MKTLFVSLCIIASISGSCLLLTATPSITYTLIGVILILVAIICLLFFVIKDCRQEIDFLKSIKVFMFVIALISLGSCGYVRHTCPTNDPNYFYRLEGSKPYKFR